ncbi:MAG: hypothetical protein U0V74_15510 [Chitinophagales bacterium]
MAGLKRTQRILSGLGLIGNFIERPLRVGDIVLNDDGQHLIWGNIEDVVDGFTLAGKTVVSNKADLKYTVESSITVDIGGSANSTVAKGEIGLSFGAKNSGFVSLKQIKRTSVKLALIDEQLKSYWKKKGFNKPLNRLKYHFIAEIIDAESGTVIFSQERNNKVVITGKNNTPLTSISVTGEGKVEYVSNSKATLEIISETAIQPLYTAVRYKADGNFEIIG